MVLYCGLSIEGWQRRINTKKGSLVHKKQLRKKRSGRGSSELCPKTIFPGVREVDATLGKVRSYGRYNEKS
jgi:hypothetical protein